MAGDTDRTRHRRAEQKRCPRCGYRLRGLPAAHICPECGLSYDPHCEVVRLRGWRWGDLTAAAFLMALTAYVAYELVFSAKPANELSACLWLGLLIVVALYAVVRARSSRDKLAINRQGVWFETVKQPARFIPWSQIVYARFDRKQECFHLICHEPTASVTWDAEVFGTDAVAEKCAAAINRLKEVYSRPEE